MGTPPQPPPPPPPAPPGHGAPQQQGNPGIAVAGFVVGLIGLLISWLFVVGLIVCVIGLILSIMGRRQAVERGAPTGLATAGLVCSIVGLVIAVIITVLVGILLDEADDALDDITFTTSTFGQAAIGWKLYRERAISPLRRLRS
jgi:hypothetical protein